MWITLIAVGLSALCAGAALDCLRRREVADGGLFATFAVILFGFAALGVVA